jgi:hypothetical protein
MKPPLAMANEILKCVQVLGCSCAHVSSLVLFVPFSRHHRLLFQEIFREFEGFDFLDSASSNPADVTIQ